MGNRSADLSWQDRVHQYVNRYGYVQEQDVRRSRMTFDVELPDRDAEMRPVYAAGNRTTSRADELARIRREREERRVPLVSKDGVRGTVAAAVFGVLALVLAVTWLSGQVQVGQLESRTARNTKRISEIDRRCQNLDIEYETRSADVDVLYTAVGQGMISAKGAKKIYLQVPDEVCMLPVASTGD